MIVAHRGASRDAPENTIPAFKLAWEQGADAIEGDFHLTKDGNIVCIHDGNTENVSNTNLVVRESTLAELRKLDVGAHHLITDHAHHHMRLTRLAGAKAKVSVKVGHTAR